MHTTEADKAEWIRFALERHGSALTRYAASIIGNADQARDVVQDVFIRLWQEEPAKIEGHLVEWLFTVCRNRALDLQRKEGRMTTLTERDMETREDHKPSPALAAENGETAGQLLRLVGQLPPNQQEVVRLKFQSGLRYEEISRITGLSVSNVGFLLHTALKTLRQRFQQAENAQPRRTP